MILLCALLLYAALGAFFNAGVRGAYLDEYLDKNGKKTQWLLRHKLVEYDKNGYLTLRFTKAINVIAFGIAAYFAVHSYVFAALFAVAMMVGQAPAIFKNEIDAYYKNRQYLDWALIVLERALAWVLPMMVVTLFYDHTKALLWLVAIPAMPLAYSVMFCEWLHTRVNRWALGEAIFGVALWSILVLV